MGQRVLLRSLGCGLWAAAGSALLIAAGAPQITAIANSASYWRAGQNQPGVAQGSLFVVLGSNLGPVGFEQSGFPLSNQLAGVSVQVHIGTAAVSGLMLYTTPAQLGVVLPSQTTVGTGTLTVTYNGQSSAAVPFTVSPAAFGIYTINQGGSGAGVVTTPDYRVIGPNYAANPGDTLIIWGTGIGPVAGDESAAPLPGNLGGAEVFVGAQPAPVLYAGRSGCCAGVDQISFTMPAGVAGCAAPLMVRVHGVASNFASIAVTAQGRQCSDPLGLPQSVLARAATGGDLRFGAIALGRRSLLGALAYDTRRLIPIYEFAGDSPLTQVIQMLANRSPDSGGRRKAEQAVREAIQQYREAKREGKPVKLNRRSLQQTLAAADPVQIAAQFGVVHNVSASLSYLNSSYSAVGSCAVSVCVTADCAFPAVMPKSHGMVLDAGNALSASGPAGASLVPKNRGEYRVELPTTAALDLPAGNYTVTGTGGADIGAFSAALALPAQLHWTNQSQISSVSRAADLQVTWNSNRNSGHVLIGGISSNPAAGQKAVFLCSEESSKGSFTIPSFVLLAMPVAPNAGSSGTTGYLFLSSHPLDNAFTAPGLDLGYFREVTLEAKRVTFQ